MVVKSWKRIDWIIFWVSILLIITTLLIMTISSASAQITLSDLEFEQKDLCKIEPPKINNTGFFIRGVGNNTNESEITNLELYFSSNISADLVPNTKKTRYFLFIRNFTEKADQIEVKALAEQKGYIINKSHIYNITDCSNFRTQIEDNSSKFWNFVMQNLFVIVIIFLSLLAFVIVMVLLKIASSDA